MSFLKNVKVLRALSLVSAFGISASLAMNGQIVEAVGIAFASLSSTGIVVKD